MGSGFCDTSHSIAGSSAEIGVVTFRMDNPIVPTNGGEVDVERITTTFTRTRTAVHASRLAAYRSLRKRVNHNKRFSVIVHRDGHVAGAASFTGHLNRVRQVVVLHPVFHGPCNIDLLPRLFVQADFSNRNRLRLGEV